MSWKSFARELQRAQRQAERRQQAYARAVARQQREDERESKARQKQAAARQKLLAKLAAANEVAQYEAYVDSLQALHKDASEAWDWPAFAKAPSPPKPERSNANEERARAELAFYKPGFFEKLFGKDKKRRAQLEAAIPSWREKDDEVHAAAIDEWREQVETWKNYRNVAERILQKDHAIYATALELTGAFEDVAKYGTVVKSGEAGPNAILVSAEITDDEIVPTEVVKQLASGKLSTKAMPKGIYWELYQDHVCSCALRLGCEIFASLPVSRAIVNIGKSELSSTTGHPEMVTYLAVHFTRDQLDGINLDAIDPSDSMNNFPHRMKLMKTKGFQPVDPITFQDQFVTA